MAEVHPEDSVSQVSSRSSTTSSNRSERAKAAKRAIDIAARAAILEKQHDIESRKRQLERELERQQMELRSNIEQQCADLEHKSRQLELNADLEAAMQYNRILEEFSDTGSGSGRSKATSLHSRSKPAIMTTQSRENPQITPTVPKEKPRITPTPMLPSDEPQMVPNVPAVEPKFNLSPDVAPQEYYRERATRPKVSQFNRSPQEFVPHPGDFHHGWKTTQPTVSSSVFTQQQYPDYYNYQQYSGQEKDPMMVAQHQPGNGQREAKPLEPATYYQQYNGPEDPLMAVLSQLVKHQRESALPATEINSFDGTDPIEFPSFMKKFEMVVEPNTDHPQRKLEVLLQFTKGEAHEMIKDCPLMDAPEQAYRTAIELLRSNYGHPAIIASAYKTKAEQWPRVLGGDKQGIRMFSTFTRNCVHAKSTNGDMTFTDGYEFLRILASKLPVALQQQWVAHVGRHRDANRSTRLEDFESFVSKISRDMNDPRIAGLGYQKKSDHQSHSTSKSHRSDQQSHSFSTSKSQRVFTAKVEPTKDNRASTAPCLHCEGETHHALTQCRKFGSLTAKERSERCFKKGLCFGCANPGHLKKNCPNPQWSKCTLCKRNHATILHDPQWEKKKESQPEQSPAEIKTGCVNTMRNNSPMMAIIPILVKPKIGNQTVATYAFVDNGCGAVFSSTELSDTLKVRTRATKLSLKTLNLTETINAEIIIDDIQIGNLQANSFIDIDADIYVKDELPVDEDDIPKQEDINRWRHLETLKLPNLNKCKGSVIIPRVTMMIGSNIPAATQPLETKTGRLGEPYAIKSPLGWIVYGLNKEVKEGAVHVHFSKIRQAVKIEPHTQQLEEQFRRYVNLDFNESRGQEELSIEDKNFLDIMDRTTVKVNGHYQTRLPLRNSDVVMPNNRHQAAAFTEKLKSRLIKQPKLQQSYAEFMTKLEVKGYAERVPPEEIKRDDGKVWYIPHHSVHNQHKPDKVRVVFNCPLKYNGTSLNDNLLQGPDMTNKLVGVMLRWRREKIAMMADIEAMFYQVHVHPDDRDMLRYLWWPQGDVSEKPADYRMKVHIFGAVSSPSCANYALRRTATDGKDRYGKTSTNSVSNDFYVDDMLKSVATEEEAIKVASDVKSLLQEGGFNLTKWSSNSQKVLESIPEDERAIEVKSLDPDSETMQRALGIQWYVETDQLGFRLNEVSNKATRRTILSTMSSVYDPIGLTSPYVLHAKIILQSLCKAKLDWDEEITGEQKKRWDRWTEDLHKISDLKISRCMKPKEFGQPVQTQLHHFADASETGYGTVSYVRYVNSEAQVHCAFVMAKSRVAPLKQMTIPRMELSASTVAVRVNRLLQTELQMTFDETHYWTDSQTVLRYINDEKSRYHTFVANRVETIREESHPKQWHYVSSQQNPADDASRGLTMDALLQSPRWLHGPQFLWETEVRFPVWPKKQEPENDPEIRKVSVNSSTVKHIQQEDHKDAVNRIIHHYSNWLTLKRAVAWWLRFKKILHQRSRGQGIQPVSKYLSIEEIQSAEEILIQRVQSDAFAEEIIALTKSSKLVPESQCPVNHRKSGINKNSPLIHLNPKLCKGLLRVGGRLQNADISDESKHQLILPRHHHIIDLILRHVHQMCGHQGRNHVLAELRQKYWVIKAGIAVKSLVKKCTVCRRQNARASSQMMADLPASRVKSDEPPFTFTGMDFFGPFEIKQGRSMKKRYGVLFTCMSSRAIHIEVAECMDTSSCINAIRRFISRRGSVKEITSDNGTNLVGANNEMLKAVKELGEQDIHNFAVNHGIKWKFNTPAASHHGGVWERQIRTVRKILQALLAEQHVRVARSEEQLKTLLCEVEATVNSRPLTKVSDDTDDLNVITPNHLLQLKTPESLPPGKFIQQDQYARRRWRQVQYLADIFWKRWTQEYLPELQRRQKWLQPERNIQVGDIVLVIDDKAPRNSWLMGLVQKCKEDQKGLVRSVQLKTETTTLNRPVTKVCLLLEQETNQM